ncbi:MAG: translocation/assembly module TamB domain-containing protein [Burkholderiales bacterium]|nr:translocation/assembly module TamB domain-containing protein [Burkholderiales bacterium]
MGTPPQTPDPTATPASTASMPQAPRPARRRLVAAALVLLLAAALAAAALLGAWALLRSPAGSAWLLARVPGVEIEGLQGALLGERLALQRLRWHGKAGTLDAEAVELRGLRMQLRPAPGLWLALQADALQAARVQWRSAPADEPRAAPPPNLMLPLALQLPVELGALAIDELAPLEDLRLRLVLGADGGRAHRIEGLALRWQAVQIEDGALQVGSAAPLPLQASLALASAGADTPLPWQARLQADGTLTELALAAVLRGPGGSALELQSRLQPFAAWPLQALSLRSQALDLSALHPQAPRTRLDGRAELQSAAADAPLRIVVELANAAPGRWDEGALPLAQATLALGGRLDAPERVEIERVALRLADGRGDAGRIEGRGLWQGHTLALELQLAGVTPQRLDARASAMTLAGPVTAEIDGLPSPDPEAGAPAAPPSLALRTTLDGRLQGAPLPVRLALQGRARADEIEIAALDASAGAARARASAILRHADGRWALRSEGELADFDPLPWWPGADGQPWARGPHRVNARWDVDASVAAAALAGDPAALPAGARGRAELRIERSLLAGTSLAGSLAMTPQDAALALKAELTLAGNRLAVDARLAGTGDGAADRWQAELDAPALDALAPLAALWPQAAAWAPRAGAAMLRAQARGRGPSLASDGRAELRGLQAGALTLAQVSLGWRIDDLGTLGFGSTAAAARGGRAAAERDGSTAVARDGSGAPARGGAPWDLALDLRGLRLRGDAGGVDRFALTTLRATLACDAAAHRLQLDAAAPLKPPPMLAQILGLAPPSDGARLALVLDGSWDSVAVAPGASLAGGTRTAQAAAATPGPRGAALEGRWQARIGRLRVDGSDALPPATAAPAAWLDASELRASLRLGAGGDWREFAVDPGRATLAGGIALRLQRFALEPAAAAGDAPRIALDAELEPLALAPLLARWQPEMGWDGDLRVGARAGWRSGAATEADIVVERLGGDLRVRDAVDQPLALGITDLRLALNARDGDWLFTQALAGHTLGEAGGLLRVRSAPDAPLPRPGDALDGSLLARVADLGVWGAWVPPGWRLQGWLQTQGILGGRLGAPEIQGTLEGAGLGARNLLQGVHLRDGTLLVRLEGPRARVERFELKAGDGRLTLAGGATLGEDPQVDLRLQAERFQVLGRIDRRLVASGGATLRLDRDRVQLDGRLDVDEGLFDLSRSDAPTLSDDVTVRRPGTPPAPPAPPAAPRRATEVDLRLGLGERLRVRGFGLDTLLAGELRLTMPGAKPALAGELRAVGGNYAAYGQKLEIERGLLRFAGAPDNPQLDVLALRPALEVEVGVAISGSAQAPRVRLHSDPEMSDTDKLSWLVLGRDPGTVDRADTALLQRAALALLAGDEPGPTDALVRQFGLDEFLLRQSDGDERETIVALGKQLSQRWYVGYERGVNATAGTWQLVYRAARRFTLRLQSGLDNAIDAIWVWRVE